MPLKYVRSLFVRFLDYELSVQSFDHYFILNPKSTIPQNGFLFEGSLRENIDPMGKLTNEEIKGFINKLDLNLDRINE